MEHKDIIEIAQKAPMELLHKWALWCGIEDYDERVIYGWPDQFIIFYDGWMNRQEELSRLREELEQVKKERDEYKKYYEIELIKTGINTDDLVKFGKFRQPEKGE